MKNKSVFIITLSFLVSTLFFNSAYAGDIEWSGVYRIEGYHLSNTELERGKELNYGLHHLVLRPKIVAGDGLTIFGQFDILNQSGFANSQLGQLWGSGVGAATPTSSDNSNTMSGHQKSDTLNVSLLYLTFSQEYGALIVGRAPLQFGLGMTYSAGRGLFDHWYDNRDMVGYKIIMGNLYFFPMLGKPSEGSIHRSDDITDYMIQVQYENPESDLELGVFYQVRSGGDQGSDAPTGISSGQNAGADLSDVLGGTGVGGGKGKVNMKTVNLYALKDTETFRAGLEASFQSGETGVLTGSDNVALGGFGIAAEFAYRPADSRWNWGLKAGTATGDDPGTPAKFEGYIFDRNYDVAMLMFNRPLGQMDFLRTGLLTGSVRDSNRDITAPDVEAISNVVYAAPSVHYSLSERWSLENTFVTGWLAQNPLSGGSDPGKSLGYEWDISLHFIPRKGLQWTTQAGLLFPGEVWKANGAYENGFAYGLSTKAAISF
ncbi:MAG: hypothetical protein HC902_04185 [Calothrix sp. SM1_5_4]|nr:hypothetical protein [Calothrix sp. SM1_5_4]